MKRTISARADGAVTLQNATAKRLFITSGAHCLHKELWYRPPYRLPDTYFLTFLLRDVIRSLARFRLRVHTLRFKTATWNSTSSPTCDLCKADFPKGTIWHRPRPVLFYNLTFTLRWLIQQCLSAQHIFSQHSKKLDPH